jgi:hypothetical protein
MLPPSKSCLKSDPLDVLYLNSDQPTHSYTSFSLNLILV